MSKDSIDEMEQIQRGLEEFLEKEVEGYREAERAAQGEGPVPIYTAASSGYQTRRRETASGQPQDYYNEPDYKSETEQTTWGREEEYASVRKERTAQNRTGQSRNAQSKTAEKAQTKGQHIKKKKKKKKKSFFKRLLIILVILCLLVLWRESSVWKSQL